MQQGLERRVAALEEKVPAARDVLLIVRRIVRPGDGDTQLCAGIHAAPPHLPAVDRNPGETREQFFDRVRSMLSPMRPGAVVYLRERSEGEAAHA